MFEKVLDSTLKSETSKDSPELLALVQAVVDRFDDDLAGILMYGSCLRTGDYFDGLVDLYVVLNSYQSYSKLWLRLANRLIPPNVFYLEAECNGGLLRSKYSVMSIDHLEHVVSPQRFEAYFWGRFCQPVAVVYARDEGLRKRLQRVLLQARDTFLAKTLPLMPAEGDLKTLWIKALAVSYGSELRAEGPGRASDIVGNNHDFYVNVIRRWAAEHDKILTLSNGLTSLYQMKTSRCKRLRAQLGWGLRRLWGKVMSLVRLTKGFFTFDGGLDYIAWKLERHSGQTVTIPDKVRQRPLLHVWGLAWKLYRQGVFK